MASCLVRSSLVVRSERVVLTHDLVSISAGAWGKFSLPQISLSIQGCVGITARKTDVFHYNLYALTAAYGGPLNGTS